MVTITPSLRETTYAPVSPTTDFPVGFPIFGRNIGEFPATDLEVVVNDSARTDFTILATFSEGVSTNAVVRMATGVIGSVIVRGKRSPRRTDQYANGAPLRISDHNYSLDRIESEVQEVRRDANRAAKSRTGEGPSLPDPEKHMALVWGEGNELINSPTDAAAVAEAREILDQTIATKDQAVDAKNTAVASAVSASADAGRAEVAASISVDAKNSAVAAATSLFNYDTLAQANANLGTIPENAGVNIIADDGNNGFYVKQGGVLVKKSSITLTGLLPQINFATKLAATRGYAYMQKAVGGFHDEYGNFGAALLQNGQFLAQIRGWSLNPNFVDYLAVENPETGERHVIYAIRQKDGFGWVGLRPALDIRVYTDGPQGNCTVWAVADGFSPWQLTPTPGDYRSPIVEGRYIKWIEIAGGVGVEHSVLAVAPVSPFDPSVTEAEHILGNGQSLQTGSYDGVVVHSVAVLPGYAVTFNSGARTLPNHDAAGVNTVIADEDISHLIDLREKNQSVSRALGETICSGASIRMKRIGGINPATGLLWSIHAIGGQSIEDVWQGTVPYSNSLKAVAQGKALVQQAGKAYRCRFSTFMGGESNRQDSKTVYMNKQLSYQAGYKTDINAITGDDDEFMIVMCQMSNWTSFTSTFARSEVPLAQLQLAIDHPTKFACVGPKYFLDTYTDGVHLTGVSEARIGAYYGRALEAIIKGGQWKPLYPTAAVRTGASVVMTFNVPDGPLVMDTTLVTDPGNFGFEWRDNGDGNAVTISNVAITSANQVTVTLSAVPTGTNGQIGIAATGIIGNHGGPTTGPRSNLRDSSSDIDDQGYPMYNWCCHSLIAVS